MKSVSTFYVCKFRIHLAQISEAVDQEKIGEDIDCTINNDGSSDNIIKLIPQAHWPCLHTLVGGL